jgi:uncharacterized protein (DUF305 family)
MIKDLQTNHYIIILLIIFLVIILLKSLPVYKEEYENTCKSELTDREYLEHMIPHHQVVIDMSKVLQQKTEWVELQYKLREIIWMQELEINIMNNMLRGMPDKISNSNLTMDKTYIQTLSDFIEPNKLDLTNTYCDPSFFDSKKHMHHLSHITDDSYIDHMIPHHQLAVDMSKILLKNTNNDMLISLAYKIIKDQQQEVINFDNLKKSKYRNKSNLIL